MATRILHIYILLIADNLINKVLMILFIKNYIFMLAELPVLQISDAVDPVRQLGPCWLTP